jgi:prolipoprotein diacylglyceryltransferase
MYPDLSYLFHDLFGTEVDNWTSIFKSFGLMLAMAFLACSWLLKSELKRLEGLGLIKSLVVKNPEKEKTSITSLVTNALVTAILFAKIPYVINHFDEFKGDPASVIFSSKGSWLIGLLVGAAFGIYEYMTNSKKDVSKLPDNINLYPHQKTMDIIIIAALSGVIGSKLFSIFENFSDFLRDPIGQFFSGSGLTVYGGLILAFVSVYWYVKKIGIKPVYMMDIAGMGILLGYAVGRIGCQISGDGDWGIVAAAQPSWWFLPDWLWAYDYPNNVSNDGSTIFGCNADAVASSRGHVEERCKTICGMRYCHVLTDKVYPTPIYETVISLIGFGILFLLRNKIKIAGMLFFIYMLYNGIERFFIEKIRVNEKYDLLGMGWSLSQWISVLFVIIGFAGIFYLSKKKPGWERE